VTTRRLFAAAVVLGVALSLCGCSSQQDADGNAAVLSRVERAHDRLHGFLSSSTTTPETDLLAEIDGKLEEDIRDVTELGLAGDSGARQGLYDFEQSEDQVRAKFLLLTGIMSGGFSSQVVEYYTCIDLRGERTTREHAVEVISTPCPSRLVEIFGLDRATFVDPSQLDLEKIT